MTKAELEQFSWKFQADRLRRMIEDQLQSFPMGQERLGRVLAAGNSENDTDAGAALICTARNRDRGLIAFWLYYRLRLGESSPMLYRNALDVTWNHDYGVLIDTVNDRRTLRAMFHWAAFPVPEDTAAMVDIWRGVHGQRSVDRAARGLAWTTDRDTACWFAMRGARVGRQPMVLKATMPRKDLFYPYNERSEFEVVCFNAIGAEIDRDPDDWPASADRVTRRNAADRANLLQNAATAEATKVL